MKGSTNCDEVNADGEKTPDEQSDTSISNIGAGKCRIAPALNLPNS
ncbi:hypothetical protein J2T08_000039 [Neorhizobium galegae]|nr:hypothetical protein [Neorhizobium galegae]